MTLRYIIHTKDKKGHLDEQVQTFEADSFIIGRGGRSDVVLQSRLLSLEHARITLSADKLLVEDLASFSGVRVNNVLTNKAALENEAVLKLGDVEFRALKDERGWALIEEREEKDTKSLDEKIATQAESLQLATHIPSFKVISLLLIVIVLGWFFLGPMFTDMLESWSSGPISNQHAMIEKNCQACHASPFVPVQDRECLTCHKLTEHSEAMPYIVKEFRELNWRCADCHKEHNGDHDLTTTSSKLCTECHARIKTLYPDTKKPNITDFATHAEFAVGIKKELVEGSGRLSLVKVSLDDKKDLIDPTHIKLNHQLHLKTGLRGPKGPVQLSCGDCHRLSEDKRLIQPMNFEKNCQSCHPLTFDDRLPTKEVPHGDPDVVFNFLYAEYGKLFLAEQGSKAAEIVVQRFKPGREVVQQAAPEVKVTRELVEKESRSAEKLLFTKTACLLCHDTSEKPSGSVPLGVDEATGVLISRYKVLNPEIPNRWMPASIFSHGAHQELRCDSCHLDVTKSTKTSDVLLPGIQGCRDCHANPGSAGKVRSDCVMCHSYHDPLVLEDGTKRHIEQVLYKLDR